MEGAAEALGRPVSVRGVVQRGDQRGRELGYPTANVPDRGRPRCPPTGCTPGGCASLDPTADDGGRASEPMPAAISVGVNPTFAGERSRRVEAYVLDRDDLELYDREVEVVFVKRLRGMLRFDSVEELVAAMDDDVERAREASCRGPTLTPTVPEQGDACRRSPPPLTRCTATEAWFVKHGLPYFVPAASARPPARRCARGAPCPLVVGVGLAAVGLARAARPGARGPLAGHRRR